MSTPNLPLLTIEEANKILKQFNCLRKEPMETALEREQIRQALLQVASHSDYQILGICADTFVQGQQALETYTKALGYSLSQTLQPIAGAVYIKFNPRSGLCYVDSYVGEHRGVLVSCQSAYESNINEMYGHLPLDLFAESSVSSST